MPFVLTLLLLAQSTQATPATPRSPIGHWQTVSDVTGQPRSVVEVYEDNGRLFARVERVLVTEGVPSTCVKCRDDRKGQPLVGLVIMRNMRKAGNDYRDGDILDPESGKVYRCRMTLDATGQRLTIRGYIGISLFGRSQVWHRRSSDYPDAGVDVSVPVASTMSGYSFAMHSGQIPWLNSASEWSRTYASIWFQ
jgi:uncharacterized protein (DUF2147 family)